MPLSNTEVTCNGKRKEEDIHEAHPFKSAGRRTWLRLHASIMQPDVVAVSVKICLSVYNLLPVRREVENVPP